MTSLKCGNGVAVIRESPAPARQPAHVLPQMENFFKSLVQLRAGISNADPPLSQRLVYRTGWQDYSR